MSNHKDIADLAFEPLDPEAVSAIVHGASWAALSPHLVNVRLAAMTLGKSKPGLTEFATSLWNTPADGETITGEPANALTELVENLPKTAKAFRKMANLVEAAEARLTVAASAMAKSPNS